MNLDKFTEVTVEKRSKSNNRKNNIFFTMNNKHITFSRGAIDALRVPYVKVMANKENKQILLLEADDGFKFLSPNKKNINLVVWTKKSIMETVAKMLPENSIEDNRLVHVNGEVTNVFGKKGILFTVDSDII